MRVLVVEDDEAIADLLQAGLAASGYTVDVAYDGTSGLQRALRHAYHVIVLDWMLPGQDGPSVCRGLREAGDRTPVLMLTARDAVDDRVGGLQAGADDYLPKPFDFRELLARVEALLRRDGALDGRTITVADLEVNVARQSAARAGVKLQLTPREYVLLETLARHAGSPVAWEMLEARVEELEAETPGQGSIATLQEKLDDGNREPLLRPVGTLGYQLG